MNKREATIEALTFAIGAIDCQSLDQYEYEDDADYLRVERAIEDVTASLAARRDRLTSSRARSQLRQLARTPEGREAIRLAMLQVQGAPKDD